MRRIISLCLLLVMVLSTGLLSSPNKADAYAVVSSGSPANYSFGSSTGTQSYGAPPGMYLGWVHLGISTVGYYDSYTANQCWQFNFPSTLNIGSGYYHVTYGINYVVNVNLYFADGSNQTVSYNITNSADEYLPTTNSNGSPLCWFSIPNPGAQNIQTSNNTYTSYFASIFGYGGAGSSGGSLSPQYFYNAYSSSYSTMGFMDTQINIHVDASYSADAASTEQANQAINAANTAAQNATNAMNAANNAANQAAAAEADANYIRNSMLSVSGGIVQDSQGTVLQAARGAETNSQNALNAINNLQTTVNNIQTAVTSVPPTVSVQTVSGATATSGSSINLVVSASSNNPPLSYSINGGGYSPLPANGIVSAPVTSPGPNAIQVSVKDNAGNVATKSITIWKLP